MEINTCPDLLNQALAFGPCRLIEFLIRLNVYSHTQWRFIFHPINRCL